MTKVQDPRPAAQRVRALALLTSLLLVFAGCAAPERLSAVPRNETTAAQIPGIPNARYFPDTQADLLAQEIMSVNVVEIRVSSEVAAGHAATVENWVAIASVNGGVSSAIAPVCM